jgi:hypothetical protein
LRKRASEEMLRQMVGNKGGFVVKLPGGRRMQYAGVRGFRERMARIRARKEEKEAEKRRSALKEQILMQPDRPCR